MEKKASRFAYIDALNVCATLCVIFLHSNYCVWEGPAGASWPSAIFIETFCYWAVPIFFMISGATLIDYRDRMSTKEFFSRRFNKTVIPWLAWSVIGLLFLLRFAGEFGMERPHLGPRSIFNGIVGTTYVDYYWFFPALFSVYLTIPVLSLLREGRTFDYLIGLGLAFNSVLPLVCQLVGVVGFGAYQPQMVMGYVLFALIGYKLSRWNPTKGQRLVIYILGVAGWLTHLIGTVATSTEAAGVSPTFKGYLLAPALAHAVAVFVLFKHADFEAADKALPGFVGRLRTASGLTFGVYLTHWFVLRIARILFEPDVHTLAFRVGGGFVIFCVCMVLSLVLKKIPGVRRIIP